MTTDTAAAQTRLATYGTLVPGRANHGQLDGLRGHWLTGTVNGRLIEAGWGADLGCPGLVLDPDGDAVDVHVFDSPDLPDHWPRLDAFEGPGYRRTVVQVRTDSGDLAASIYLVEPPSAD